MLSQQALTANDANTARRVDHFQSLIFYSLRFSVCWKREIKCRPGAELRFYPDASTVTSDDLFANRKSHSRAGILAAMKPLENSEHLLGILWLNANAVIGHAEFPFTS